MHKCSKILAVIIRVPKTVTQKAARAKETVHFELLAYLVPIANGGRSILSLSLFLSTSISSCLHSHALLPGERQHTCSACGGKGRDAYEACFLTHLSG